MIRKNLYLLILTFLFFNISINVVFSQDIPDRPVPPRLVTDLANMLNAEEVNILERKLVAFNDSTSTQIAIVIVPSLMGYEKADFAQRLGEKWGIGQKGKDNGVVILVKPKTAGSNGEVFISQGYGIEGVIPDITCGEIVDYEILPAFRNGDYFGGLDKATNTLMSLARGEFSAAEYRQSPKKKSGKDIPVGFIIIVIIIFIAMISRKAGGKNNKNISTGGLPFWLLLGSGARSG